ncbi:MAG: ArsR/SmtB family transcription factor [Ruminococcus sp.]
MDQCAEGRRALANEFSECRKAIIALGDETRQSIIMALLQNEKVGLRVGEITEKTHLSRPAVSHHLQILKDAKIVAMRRKGTMNFYYMSADETEWGKLKRLIDHIHEIIHCASDQNYPDNHLGEDEN